MRRKRPFVGRGKPTRPAYSGHLAAYGDRLDQQAVVAVLITV
jgi:hypothetical protein